MLKGVFLCAEQFYRSCWCVQYFSVHVQQPLPQVGTPMWSMVKTLWRPFLLTGFLAEPGHSTQSLAENLSMILSHLEASLTEQVLQMLKFV